MAALRCIFAPLNSIKVKKITIEAMRNFKYLFVLLAVSLFTLASCDDDNKGNEEPAHSGSTRDWTYSGSRLTVTLDGQAVASVKQASVKSQLKRTQQEGDVKHLIYDTDVTISGFPTASATTTLSTEMHDLQSFAGDTTLNGVKYSYKGVFTGDPLAHYSKQGLVIAFTTQK